MPYFLVIVKGKVRREYLYQSDAETCAKAIADRTDDDVTVRVVQRAR